MREVHLGGKNSGRITRQTQMSGVKPAGVPAAQNVPMRPEWLPPCPRHDMGRRIAKKERSCPSAPRSSSTPVVRNHLFQSVAAGASPCSQAEVAKRGRAGGRSNIEGSKSRRSAWAAPATSRSRLRSAADDGGVIFNEARNKADFGGGAGSEFHQMALQSGEGELVLKPLGRKRQ